jgi:hypothetical protein
MNVGPEMAVNISKIKPRFLELCNSKKNYPLHWTLLTARNVCQVFPLFKLNMRSPKCTKVTTVSKSDTATTRATDPF